MTDRRYTPVDGDPFAASAAPAPKPTPTANPPKLRPVDGDPFADPTTSSAGGAFARSAVRGAAPALSGVAGFGAGFAAGGLLTAPAEAAPGVGTIINAVGALGGGLAGAFGAGYLVDKAQDKLLSILPSRLVKAVGQDDAQRAADQTQHSAASFAGSLAPMLLTMRPGFAAAKAVPAGASKLTRLLATPAGGHLVGAALGGGTEAAQEVATGNFDPSRLAIATGAGAALNRPTRLGGALFQAGGNATIRAAQAGAGVARSAADIGANVVQAAKDAADIRSGALIENPPQPIRAANDGAPLPVRALPSPATLRPVEGDPFAGGDVAAPPAPVAAPRLLPVVGDPFAAPQPPEASAPALPPVVEPQPVAAQPAAAGGDGLRPDPIAPPAPIEPAAAPSPEPVLHAPDLRPDPGPLVDGEHYVTSPAGNRIRAKFEVVPAASVAAATGDLQNRDRSRDTTDLQVQGIVSGFDPSRLGASAETDRGAPIVGSDGAVESGNGRMLALDRIQSDPQYADKAEAYRQYIEAQGHSTDGIENPRLIRRRTNEFTPEQRRQFVVDSNKDAKLSMTSVERARSDADGLDADSLSLYRGGDVSSAGNSDFVKRFNSRLTPGELAGQIDADGQPSQEGTTRIENALMARAYENPAVLSKLIEARDNNIRSIGAGMLDNAGAWATLRADVKEGNVKPEFDVTAQLVEAARRVSDIRAKGTKIGDALAQGGMFEKTDPLVHQFMRAFYNPELTRAASREAITSAIATYARRAAEQTAGAKLFGGDETTPQEIMSNILAERQDQTGALLDAPEPSGNLDTWHDEIKARRNARLGHTQENDDVPQGSPQRNEGGAVRQRGENQGGQEGAGGVAPGRSGGGTGERPAGRGTGGAEGSNLLEGVNETPDYSARRSPALQDAGPYDPKVATASFTNRASLFNSAAEAIGIDPDKFTLMPAPRQVALLRDAIRAKFGITVLVHQGMQERFAIDQMLDAFQNVQGMAHVLDLPNEAMSLGGKLKVQLQKQGKFLGLFKPGETAIVLPQRSNSFAHEWAHALDYHLLGLMTDAEGRGLSGTIRKLGVRADPLVAAPATVREAFVDLLNAMFFDKAGFAQKIMALEAKIAATQSGKVKAEAQLAINRLKGGASQAGDIRSAFYKDAAGFGGPGGDYWTSPTEMFARAFEAYTSFKLEAAGLTTEFIGKGDAAYLSMADERLAKTFPKGEERAAIFAAFEQLFGNLADGQTLGNGSGAAKPGGTVRRITDYDKTPAHEKVRGIINRELHAIRRAMLVSKKRAADRMDDPKGLAETAADLNGVVFGSMTGNLRMIQARSKSPTLQKLIDLLTKQDGQGDRTVPRTFAEDVHLQSKRAINRLSNILKANKLDGLTADQDVVLRDLLTGSREDGPPNFIRGASAIRHLLDEEFYVNQRAGIDLGYTRNGYLARVLDLPKVYHDQPGFVAQAVKVYEHVYDNEFGTDPDALLTADNLDDFMKMARLLQRYGPTDLPSLDPVRAIQRQINKLAAAKLKSDDPDAVQAKIDELTPKLSDAFGELHAEARVGFAQDRAEAWLAKINLGAGEEHNAASPDTKYTKARALPAEADKLMEKFYLSDPVEGVINYLNTSARRTSYARRFGNDGKKRAAMFEAMAGEGVSLDDQASVSRILDTATGRVRSNLPRSLEKAAAFVSAYTQMALLPRAMLSSLAEPWTAGLVTNDSAAGFKLVGSMLSSLIGSPSGRARWELARAMGIVTDHASDNIMEARYGQTYADATRWDRMTSNMFRRTGLTGLTRAQKTAMVGLSHAYLDNLSHSIDSGKPAAKANAIALMREFGIRDPEKFAVELLKRNGLPSVEDLDSDFGYDYSTAQLRLNSLVIQEPGMMDRPEFAANPVARVFYALQGFTYGYYRNIVKRNAIILHETGKKGSDRGGKASAAILGSKLFAAAAVAYAIGVTVSTLREAALNPVRFKQMIADGTLESQMALLGFNRTFSFGAADTVINAAVGLKYRRDLSNVMIGAGPATLSQNFQKALQPITANSRTSNSAEYNSMQGVFGLTSPFLNFGLSRLPGGPLIEAATGAGMAMATSPAARDAVATAIVGPKNGTPQANGKKLKSGPTAYDRALDGVFGPLPGKKKASDVNPYLH